MAVYRFNSNLVYVEAKGDFDTDSTTAQRLKRLNIQEFDALREGAFNVRYFPLRRSPESVNPEGPRELIGLGTSEALTKDVTNLKYFAISGPIWLNGTLLLD